MNPYELQAKRKKREEDRYMLYYREMSRCFCEIEEANTTSTHIFFVLPVILVSNPHYRFEECLALIKHELKRRGFKYKVLEPGNHLFISWD